VGPCYGRDGVRWIRQWRSVTMLGRLCPTFTAAPGRTADTRPTTATTTGVVIANSTGPSNPCRAESATDNTAAFFPTSTATTAAITGAPQIGTTHLRRASGGPARQRQILEAIRRIPSDTSGDVREEDWHGTRHRVRDRAAINPAREDAATWRTQLGIS
jgi:hypothetical protein